jgi:hypothetical protein
MNASRSGRGPDFMGIGLQKAGTRWLYLQLKGHPRFWMPPIKELHFFDKVAAGKKFPAPRMVAKLSRDSFARAEDRAFAGLIKQLKPQPKPDLDLYASLFDPAGDSITGEITPGYGALPPDQIAGIARRFPDLKIVLMLRDPISRLWSNVNDAANKGALPPQSLLTVEGMRSTIALPVISAGSYPARTFRKWASFFPHDRIGTFFLDDVIGAPETTRAAVFSFFHVDAEKAEPGSSPSFNSKAGRARAEMTVDVRTFLISAFEEELRDCASLFGGRAAEWLAKYGL